MRQRGRPRRWSARRARPRTGCGCSTSSTRRWPRGRARPSTPTAAARSRWWRPRLDRGVQPFRADPPLPPPVRRGGLHERHLPHREPSSAARSPMTSTRLACILPGSRARSSGRGRAGAGSGEWEASGSRGRAQVLGSKGPRTGSRWGPSTRTLAHLVGCCRSTSTTSSRDRHREVSLAAATFRGGGACPTCGPTSRASGEPLGRQPADRATRGAPALPRWWPGCSATWG